MQHQQSLYFLTETPPHDTGNNTGSWTSSRWNRQSTSRSRATSTLERKQAQKGSSEDQVTAGIKPYVALMPFAVIVAIGCALQVAVQTTTSSRVKTVSQEASKSIAADTVSMGEQERHNARVAAILKAASEYERNLSHQPFGVATQGTPPEELLRTGEAADVVVEPSNFERTTSL